MSESTLKRSNIGRLRELPDDVAQIAESQLLELLRDPEIDPNDLNRRGWAFACRKHSLLVNAGTDEELELLAGLLEEDEVARSLLQESPVGDLAVERTLTRLRRWLVLGGRVAQYPRLGDALRAQTALNGGAWPFEDDERDLIASPEGKSAGGVLAGFYLPDGAREPVLRGSDFADEVTSTVAAHYERWPYPVWRRITVPPPESYSETLKRLGADEAAESSATPEILIAGCGTGWDAA
jgi:hypothetical protein